MITTPTEYYSYLHQIQNNNAPSIALLEHADTLYELDLINRKINGPEFLSVEKDHSAETIYFICDRYHDYIDLADTVCIIQYINANGEAKIYPVPFYDVQTFADKHKMIIPWNISIGATLYSGIVKYSIRFYQIQEMKKDEYKFNYNLNTQVAQGSILYGLNDNNEFKPDDLEISAANYEILLSRINTVENHKDLYWTDLYSYT